MQDRRFGGRVDSAQRVIEQHDLRIARERSRYRRALLLTAAEIDASFAEHCVVSVRKIDDCRVELRDGRCRARRNLVVAAVRQVCHDRVAEQHRLLRHVADGRTQRLKRQRFDRHTVDENLPFLRIPESRHEVHQCALATACRTDDADGGARRYRE